MNIPVFILHIWFLRLGKKSSIDQRSHKFNRIFLDREHDGFQCAFFIFSFQDSVKNPLLFRDSRSLIESFSKESKLDFYSDAILLPFRWFIIATCIRISVQSTHHSLSEIAFSLTWPNTKRNKMKMVGKKYSFYELFVNCLIKKSKSQIHEFKCLVHNYYFKFTL